MYDTPDSIKADAAALCIGLEAISGMAAGAVVFTTAAASEEPRAAAAKSCTGFSRFVVLRLELISALSAFGL